MTLFLTYHLPYPELWANVHFWCFSLAINIVFFPRHALDLAGFPRRIPDYSDGYADWNHLMTIGSILTAIAILIFLIILFHTNRPLSNKDIQFYTLRHSMCLKLQPII
jgi:heme/copper-type cytochrome/quinol oxidase subunit 1